MSSHLNAFQPVLNRQHINWNHGVLSNPVWVTKWMSHRFCLSGAQKLESCCCRWGKRVLFFHSMFGIRTRAHTNHSLLNGVFCLGSPAIQSTSSHINSCTFLYLNLLNQAVVLSRTCSNGVLWSAVVNRFAVRNGWVRRWCEWVWVCIRVLTSVLGIPDWIEFSLLHFTASILNHFDFSISCFVLSIGSRARIAISHEKVCFFRRWGVFFKIGHLCWHRFSIRRTPPPSIRYNIIPIFWIDWDWVLIKSVDAIVGSTIQYNFKLRGIVEIRRFIDRVAGNTWARAPVQQCRSIESFL